MSAQPRRDVTVRRIRADEWRAVRALRLESTSDPDAAIAFLERPLEVARRTDEFWMQRAATASGSDTAAQFVAEAEGRWIGSLSVIIRASGQLDHLGRQVDERRADVVGVYVRPAERGAGVVDRLLQAGADWARVQGLTALRLDVHRDNRRAQGAYARAGYRATGILLTSIIGPEIEMVRTLTAS